MKMASERKERSSPLFSTMFSFFVVFSLCVQVHAAVIPHVFGSRSHYQYSDEPQFPGTNLWSEAFSVYFDKDVLFPECFINENMAECIDVVTSTGDRIIPAITGTPNSRVMPFRLMEDPSAPISAATDVMTITMTMKAGTVCQPLQARQVDCSSDGPTNIESQPFTIEVARELQVQAEWSLAGVLQATLKFNHDAYNLVEGGFQPLVFTLNDGVVRPETESFIVKDGTTWVFQTSSLAPAGTEACIQFTSSLASDPVFGDVYGSFIDTIEFQQTSQQCFTLPANECDPVWSEWSECLYECTPIASDVQYNNQYRSRKNENFPNCNIPDEERPCQTSGIPCRVFIKDGETGSECTISENTCNTGRQASGCYCGDGCETDDSKACCQSYYSSCMDNAAADPAYFYDYAPCWTPTECAASGQSPACSDRGFTSKNGACSGRDYVYGCWCGIALGCQDLGGTDRCCSGFASYETNCESVSARRFEG